MSGYPPYTSFYLSQSKNPNLISNERNKAVDSGAWLLTPAIVGTGAYFLMNFLWKGSTGCRNKDSAKVREKEKSKRGMPGVILYSALSTAAIALYVYEIMVATNGRILSVFVPVSGAISVLILYYAAAYNWVYRWDPASFSGENLDGDPYNALVTFIYFSITTFATAGGDIAPISNTTRILVGLEVLFFIFIFTMGLVFFSSP